MRCLLITADVVRDWHLEPCTLNRANLRTLHTTLNPKPQNRLRSTL